jgi:hypothetical protein
MPHLKAGSVAIPLAILACLSLAACGNSSSKSSSSVSNQTTHTTTATPTPTSTPATTTPTSSTSTAPSAGHSKTYALAVAVARCLRRYGVQVAEPNAAGTLNIASINTHTPQYRVARVKCHPVILEAFSQDPSGE